MYVRPFYRPPGLNADWNMKSINLSVHKIICISHEKSYKIKIYFWIGTHCK